jgi:HSP20 family protein
MDMYETDDDVVINADLPGLKPEDVDISVTGNTLNIKGEFRSEEEGERGNVHFQERRYGKFQRSVSLPSGIDTDAAEAEFEDGILKIALPKSEEAKPKQIPVKGRS